MGKAARAKREHRKLLEKISPPGRGLPSLAHLPWKPLERVDVPLPEDWGGTPFESCWTNGMYQVMVRRFTNIALAGAEMVHLSIKRRDREALHDWRHLQRIKNELVGPECEAVELYPAESRLVDGANQYHLWVLVNPEFKWPVGHFGPRLVGDAEDALAYGARQRPLEE